MQGKKLSARRGSVSAPDPLGKHKSLNDDPNRSSSSTLTIVRIVDPTTSPATPGFVTPFTLPDPPSSPTHSSRRSIRRHGSTSSSTTTENRLSFAFSSFSPVSPTQPSSPFSSSNPQTQSSRTGSSPSSSPRIRPSSPQFTRRHSASGTPALSKPNLSPEQLVELARHSTTPRYVPGTPTVHPPQPAANSSSPITGFVASPATFTLLPDDVYLPFIDRAAETAHLISTPPTMKLFSLLAQIFPSQVPHEEIQDPFVVDPSTWSFNTLRRWLTDVDRSTANDALWVKQARKCVRAHSELIWERLKGALGVPPELELDESDEDSGSIDSAVEESTLPHLTSGHVHHDVDIEHHSPTQVTHDSEQALTIEPIIATASSNPPQSSQGTNNPPPSSLPPVLSQSAQSEQGLQDIVEDLEEEEAAEVEVVDGDRAKFHTEHEAQIHGLRVCTSPVPTFSSITAHVASYPPSPAVDMNASGRDSIEPHTPEFFLPPLTRRLSRTSSHGSVGSIGRPASGSYTYRDIGHNSGASEIGDSESERGYDPVGDRAPGNPLFPSNFARLALGPTLRANNPSLRSSHATISRWARWAPGNRPPSWVEAWDAAKQEYATSVTSVSSIGGGE